MVMGICFGIAHFLHLFTLGKVLSSLVLLARIRRAGLGVSFGMAGYLPFLAMLSVTPGRLMLLVLQRIGWKLHSAPM